MKLIKHLAFCSLILTLGCKNNKVDLTKNDSLKKSWERNVSVEEANKIIDSATKNIHTSKVDVFIYKGDKGYNEKEAKLAKDFVLKALHLHPTKENDIQCDFCITDSSYQVEYGSIMSNPEPHLHTIFYRFYPKSKKILNGLTFEEIEYKKLN